MDIALFCLGLLSGINFYYIYKTRADIRATQTMIEVAHEVMSIHHAFIAGQFMSDIAKSALSKSLQVYAVTGSLDASLKAAHAYIETALKDNKNKEPVSAPENPGKTSQDV